MGSNKFSLNQTACVTPVCVLYTLMNYQKQHNKRTGSEFTTNSVYSGGNVTPGASEIKFYMNNIRASVTNSMSVALAPEGVLIIANIVYTEHGVLFKRVMFLNVNV